jgi:hypothetical protein
MLLRYCLSDFEIVPVASVVTGITSVFYIPHAMCVYCKIFMFTIFYAYFMIIFLYRDISLTIARHVPFTLPRIMMSGLMLGMVPSICTCWFHSIFT